MRRVLSHIFPELSDDEIIAKLNITAFIFQKAIQGTVPYWLMKQLVEDYKVNPLAVFHNHKKITL
jgi:hypothetical protein